MAVLGSKAGVFVHVLGLFQAALCLPISPVLVFLSVHLFLRTLYIGC